MAVLALVVVVAMGSAVWRYVQEDAPLAVLRLTDVRGDVTVGRGGGAAVVADEGLELHPDDRVATGTDSRAVLTLGPSTHIRVGPTSSLEVVEVDASAVSLELQDGRLHATVRPESGAVRVGNRGRAVVATSGAFDVGVAGDVMQISATEGALSLSGLDATRLEAGQTATVIERHAEVGVASEELLLAVQWPTEGRTRAESTVVTGQTQAGARVRLRWDGGEVQIRADETGRFHASIPLEEGENTLSVDAVDALGHEATDAGELQVRDTTGPAFRGGGGVRTLIAVILALGAAADEVEVIVVDGDLRPGRASILEVGALGADGAPRLEPLPLDLSGATIRGPIPHRPGVWRYTIVPAVDAEEVVVSGVGVPRSFPSAPPPMSSLLVPGPVDASAAPEPVVLHIGGLGPLPVDALEIATSEGAITDIREVENGVDITVVPDDLPVPRFMLVGVRDRRRDEQPAWIPVRLVARPRLPFEAERGATLVLEVGGRRYGPYTADSRGHVESRLEQYPGDRLAVAVFTDDLGNSTRTEVPLVSQADPVVVVFAAGEVLPGRRPPVLHVKAIEPSGAAPAESPSCSTPAAELPVRTVSRGAWFVALPPADTPDDVRVVCTLGATSASARLAVAHGVAATLDLRVSPDDLRADFPVAEVRYALEDLRGERLPLDRVEVTALRGTVTLEPYDGFVGRGEYEGRAAVTSGSDTVRATWRAPRGEGQVEELELAWKPEGAGRLRVSARAVDRIRRPLPDVALVLAIGEHRADATTGPDGWATAVLERNGRGLSVLGASTPYRSVQAIVPPGDPGIAGPERPDLEATAELVLLPGRVAGISLDVEPELLRAGPGAVAWVTVKLADGAGQPVTDEPIELEATEGDIGDLQGRPDGSFVAEYTPLPSERQREVLITARTESLFTSASLQLQPRVVRLSFGPWFGATTNFGTLTRPIGGIDLDIRTRSKLTGESMMVRIGVAGTWLRQDVEMGEQVQEWTSTLIPITAGLLFRDDRGPVGLWAGGGLEAIAHQLSVTTAEGADVADGLSMHFGPIVFTGASHRALGGEVLLSLRASWVPVAESEVGFEGNLGGLAVGVGYRLVY